MVLWMRSAWDGALDEVSLEWSSAAMQHANSKSDSCKYAESLGGNGVTDIFFLA